MARMSFATALPVLKERALSAIDAAFPLPNKDYGFKILEAKSFQETGLSSLIKREAAAKNIAPDELATTILINAGLEVDREIRRIEFKEAVRAASDAAAVRAVLVDAGIKLDPQQVH